jgi:hypothetical protein
MLLFPDESFEPMEKACNGSGWQSEGMAWGCCRLLNRAPYFLIIPKQFYFRIRKVIYVITALQFILRVIVL